MAMPPKDVRDHWAAGVALVYGEIGELLTRVEKLRGDVPNLVAAGTRELNTSIISIVKATRGAQVAIEQLAAQEKHLVEAGAQERRALEQTVRQLLEALEKRPEPAPAGKSLWVLLALGFGLLLVSAAGAYVGGVLAR